LTFPGSEDLVMSVWWVMTLAVSVALLTGRMLARGGIWLQALLGVR
jgi:hypothetical protein